MSVRDAGAMNGAAPEAGGRPRLRLVAREGRPPLGLVFAAIGALGGASVSLLHLDRLPITLCQFKAMTGWPCPTCGGTRAVGRLFALDLAGAVAMNPLAVLAGALLAAWALADLVLLPRRRALGIEVDPRLASLLRFAALAAFLLNWLYLLAARR